MPLVLFTGHPASGKTTRATQLRDYLEANHCGQGKQFRSVNLVNDEGMSNDRNENHISSFNEKKSRADFKAAVDRLVSRDVVVIADALNYIKGFRYELFCISRSNATTHAVVYCECPVETGRLWNAQRELRYDDEVFEGLVNRYECPNQKNRWDSPLFHLRPDEETPVEKIAEALVSGKKMNPSSATQPQKLSDTNYLYELDQVTQNISQAIMASQRSGADISSVTVPRATEKVLLTCEVTSAELRRLRAQFVKFTKMHPPQLTHDNQLGNMFVGYLNTNIGSLED